MILIEDGNWVYFGIPLNPRLGCFFEGDSRASGTTSNGSDPPPPPPPGNFYVSETKSLEVIGILEFQNCLSSLAPLARINIYTYFSICVCCGYIVVNSAIP